LKSIVFGLAELYYPEFEIIVDVLLATDADTSVVVAIALTVVSSPIRTDSWINVEGRSPGNKPIVASGRASDLSAPLVARGLVAGIDGSLSLTSKGTAFAKFARGKGFTIDACNDEVFTLGHESFFEKVRKEHQARASESGTR
jgi:hypothetical protein